MIHIRQAAGTILAAAVVAVGASAPAAHAESWYSLDGQKSTEREATSSPAGGCAAVAAPSGEIACFTSEQARARTEAASLRSERIPPGYVALPPADKRAAAIQAAELTAGAPRASRRATAKAAQDGCNRNYTHVHTGYSYGGSYGYFGYTASWQNHTATFNDSISSYKASSLYIPYWHDLPNGSGAYYNLANICRLVPDLSAGSWDNRFTSFLSL